MLHRFQLVALLEQVCEELFIDAPDQQVQLRELWQNIAHDHVFAHNIAEKKQEFLVPQWQGLLAHTVKIMPQPHPYTVISVDGSQIYYDKHQGPPCFVINVGYMQLSYGAEQSDLQYGSEPFVTTRLDASNDFGSVDFVNLQRELQEFQKAYQLMQVIAQSWSDSPKLCLFDGSLIFFHLQGQGQELQDFFLQQYLQVLDQLYAHKMLIAGYISLPKNKELVNLCLLAAQGNESLQNYVDRLVDADIATLFLQPHHRSTIFKSKAPISYLYQDHLKPYFCYVHVGAEIIRLEFPAWIAQSEALVDQICAIALDQAMKGCGYPVCLFEAHEQAVINSADRYFFYSMLERMSQKRVATYLMSQKSRKKAAPLV